MGAIVTRFSPQGGTSGMVTIAGGCVVTQIQAFSSDGGTLVITPTGAAAALPTITLPAGASWFVLDFDPALQELVAGATIMFTTTDGYFVAQTVIGGV